MGHEGCGEVAQQERGVQGQGRDVGLCSVRNGNSVTTLAPTLADPVGPRGVKCSLAQGATKRLMKGAQGDSSGDQSNAEKVDVKYNYKVRG